MRYTILFCTLLFSLFVTAQESTYLFGDQIPLRVQDDYQGLLHSDSTGYTLHLYENGGKGLLDLPGRTLILERYDTNFKQEYSYAYGEEGTVSVDLMALKDLYIWIVIEKVRSYKYECSMISIDKNGKEGKKKFLFEAKIDKVDKIPVCQLQLSPDSTQVAFIANFDWNSKKEPTDIFTAVIDNKAEILWKKFTTLKGNQKQYDIKDYKLNSQGEIIFVAKVYNNKKGNAEVKNKRDEKVAGYNMSLMKIDEANRLPQVQKLELKNAFVSQASIKVLPGGDIICTGLTSPKHNGHINGIFYSKYDPEWNLISNDTKELSTMDLIQLSKGNADVNFKKKKNLGLDESFDLCDIIPFSDGSCLLTLEQNFVRQSSSYNADPFNNSFYGSPNRNNMSTTAYYKSNDIITVYVTSNGNISSIDLLPKKQEELVYFGYQYVNVSEEMSRKSSMYLSHTTMLHNDNVYFIYNDHIKNINAHETEKQKVISRVKDMESVIVSNDQGPIVKGFFFDEGDAELLVSPTKTKQISSNQLFFSTIEQNGGRRRALRFGVMTFE